MDVVLGTIHSCCVDIVSIVLEYVYFQFNSCLMSYVSHLILLEVPEELPYLCTDV